MLNEKASGASKVEVLSLLIGIVSLVVTLLTLGGFPFRSSHYEQRPSAPMTTPSVMTTTSAQPSSSVSHRSKKTTSRATLQKEPVSQEPMPRQPVEEARSIAVEPAPSSVSITPTVMPMPVSPVVAEREPIATDGYYRGTVVDCQQESNIPGSAAKLCVDLGAKTVSAAMDNHLYVLVGGWKKRIPLYAGDVIRFEVRQGELASAELLSDSHGR